MKFINKTFLCVLSLLLCVAHSRSADRKPIKKSSVKIEKKTQTPKGKATVQQVRTEAVSPEFVDDLKRQIKKEVLRELKASRKIAVAGGEQEEIEAKQGSFKISPTETALEEASDWDSLNKRRYNIKRGFIRIPGTSTYIRPYGFVYFVAAATRHQRVAGYTADYSIIPEHIAPSDKPDWAKNRNDFNMLVNESRIGLETFTQSKLNDKVCPMKTVIEFDFSNGNNGSSSLSKDYRVKLRHAYLSFGNFVFGQTTTSFADSRAAAEVTNGPIGSTTKRLLQMAYTHPLSPKSEIKIALERQADKFLDDDAVVYNENTPNLNSHEKKHKYHSSASFPTIVLSGRRIFEKGHIGAAIALRHISLDGNDEQHSHSSKHAVCGRVSGSYSFLESDSIFGIMTYGSSPGSYISDYQTTTYIDSEKNYKLKSVEAFAVSAGLRHFWTQWHKIRSTVAIGYITLKNPAKLKDGDGKAVLVDTTDASKGYNLPKEVVKSMFSVTANVVASVLPNLEVGLEYSYGKKKLEDKRKGKNQALIFSARLDF